MRPTSQTISSVAVSSYNWIPLGHHVDWWNVSYGVVPSGTGDLTYKIQYTINDLERDSTITAYDAVSGKTGSFASTLSTPATGIRFVATAASGAAGVTFTVLQIGN